MLLYHRISDRASNSLAPFSVPPGLFADHLDLMLELGYTVVPLSALLDGAGAPADGRRLAAITFDDGYADFTSAAVPLLQERGLPATIYLTTGWLTGGRGARSGGPDDPFLDWSELPSIVDAGMEIGGHSHSHPQLDTLSRAAIRDEVARCKAMLEDAAAAEVVSFAYPHGYNDPRVRRAVREAGYTSATAVANRIAHLGGDPLRIPRLMLGPETSVPRLRSLLSQPEPPLPQELAAGALTVGWRAYRRTKAVLTRRPGRASWAD